MVETAQNYVIAYTATCRYIGFVPICVVHEDVIAKGLREELVV
jgi:hypothetical protein